MNELIGILGMLLLLIGYFSVRRKGVLSHVLNMLGATSMIIYGWLLHAIPVVILNVAWICIGGYHFFEEKRQGERSNTKALKFRPSSHSTDYTIVSIFNSEKGAKQAKKEIEEMLDDPAGPATFWGDILVDLRGRTLLFKAYTNYSPPKEVIDLLAAAPDLLKAIQYVDHDFVEITITFPVRVSIESAPLLLSPPEADALRELLNICKSKSKRDRIILQYAGGNCAFVPSENAIYIGSACIKLPWRNWHVTLVPSEINRELCNALGAKVILERKPLNRWRSIKKVRRHERAR